MNLDFHYGLTDLNDAFATMEKIYWRNAWKTTKYKPGIMVWACFNVDIVGEIVCIQAGSKMNGDIYL